jgi:PAS domain S-box-containing protein
MLTYIPEHASVPGTNRRFSREWRGLALGLLAAFCWGQSFALNPEDKPADYSVAHWDSENGLPHNSIKQLCQTKDGYLWIGTQAGLARFDGLNFTVFNRHNTPAFDSSQITSLAETGDGSLWIGTSDGLVRYHAGTFSAYTRADGVKDRTINSLCVAPDGTLWIGGHNGVTRWVNGKFVNDVGTSGHSTLGMRNITVVGKNQVWLGVGTEALRFQNGIMTAFGREQGLPDQQIQTISAGPDGSILAVTQNGLFQLKENRFAPLEQNTALSSQRISRTLLDHAGNLWIGTASGLDRCYHGHVVPYADKFGRRLGVVDALLEDREGCVWAGTSEGLYRLTDRRALSLTESDGVPGSLVLALKESTDGSLWVSSWGSGVARFKNGEITRYSVGAPLSHETVTAIYEAPGGVMWFGNRGCSLDRLENGKVTTFIYQSGVATSRPVTAIIGDDNGTLLLGIGSRGLFTFRNGAITPVAEARALSSATVWTFHRSRDGRLFMGTNAGLYERKADRSWELVPFPSLSSPLSVHDVLETDDGYWLAAEGVGLIRWQHGSVHAYDAHCGMVDDSLFTVLDDGEDSLWVSSARGLARVAKKDLDAVDQGRATTVNCMTFGRSDGLASGSSSGNGNPGAILLKDGRILTATDKGVAITDPRRLRINKQPPTVIVENVIGDTRSMPATASIVLPAGTSRLEIRYTALSLMAPQRLRFRYQLEGADPQWIEAGSERRAYYTHLSPGSYTFHVTASNSDGVWSETGASAKITVQPYFYETTGFRTVCVATLLAAVFLLFWLRGRNLKIKQLKLQRANDELDQRVRERTAELFQSHGELQQREQLFRLIFEHAPVGISWKRADLGDCYHFNATFRRILDLPSLTLPDFSLLTGMLHPEDAPRQAELAKRIESGQINAYTLEQRYRRPDGEIVWGMLSVAVIRDQQGRVTQDIGILEDVTARKKAERELAETYKNLVEVSRTAGMAEVATGVLHNVGNVLNSLNISATVIGDGLRHSKVESFAKLSALIQEHSADLAAYLVTDPKGRRIPEYVDSLATHFVAEQQRLIAETSALQQNVEHIKEIVAMQQTYATRISLSEPLDPTVLMEDALRINSTGLARHNVRIAREFKDAGQLLGEKAKVIQILLNLIGNAKDACAAGNASDKLITLGIERGDSGRVRLTISDSGIGIAPENLVRVFAHGFTTKPDGHGFGLHSAANAAKEMNGALTVQSKGVGFGATFILELPGVPAAAVPANAAA